jgi:hypothetical protein
MKKYILFEYDDCYPSGGLTDITADSDDIEILKAQATTSSGDNIWYDNSYIVDRDTWQRVWEK